MHHLLDLSPALGKWRPSSASYATASVYTIQAIYVSTPAAVLWAILIFGGGADVWLWVGLIILMLALWLNNSGRATASANPRSRRPSRNGPG